MTRLLLLLLVIPFVVSARIVDLEDREGRQIQADVISLRDGILTLRRTDSNALFRISLETLSEKSQAHLHASMTENLVPTLRVETISSNRRSKTHWRNSWGEYSKTTTVERVFGIIVSSTSSFRKEVDLFVYWSVGGEVSYTVERGFIGGAEEIEMATSESASQRDTRYDYYYGNYRYVSGDASVEMAVLVKDMDGKVLTTWSTSRALEDFARRSNDRLTPRQIERMQRNREARMAGG